MFTSQRRRNKIASDELGAEEIDDGTAEPAPTCCGPPRRCSSRACSTALSRVHPAVPVIIFLPAIAALMAWSLSQRERARRRIALLVAGYALWTLFEYWLHRIVFHFEPEDGLGARMHWIIHGVHHDHPNDPLRLVMPPAVSVPLARGRVRAPLPDLRRPLRARRSAPASSPATWSTT